MDCEASWYFSRLLFFEFLGLDKNMRDNFIDNPYYESCREFCEKYDQNSFDPDYDTLDLEFFLPMVKELFKTKTFNLPSVINDRKLFC